MERGRAVAHDVLFLIERKAERRPSETESGRSQGSANLLAQPQTEGAAAVDSSAWLDAGPWQIVIGHAPSKARLAPTARENSGSPRTALATPDCPARTPCERRMQPCPRTRSEGSRSGSLALEQ